MDPRRPIVPVFGAHPALARGPDGDGDRPAGPYKAQRVSGLSSAVQLKRHGAGPHVADQPAPYPVKMHGLIGESEKSLRSMARKHQLGPSADTQAHGAVIETPGPRVDAEMSRREMGAR